ncbi:hypothetical protein F2Q69_00054332 [Brassica cretica]|uniref:Uncharacterized protein n=1 Tax=Brassica cretica TaxID=69181 RepID=A0A8S9N9Y2_BRACR|nr:hypothetical protein F2Q69_00054332 [Brassica cretica]
MSEVECRSMSGGYRWVGMGGRQKSSLGRRWKVSVGRLIGVVVDRCGTFAFADDYLSSDLGPQLLLVGPEKVLIDSNNGVSIDTPFSSSINATSELSIDVPSRERYERV